MIFNCEKYNVEHITTIEQMKEFASYLVEDLKVNINPENDFADYIEYETGEPKKPYLFDWLYQENGDYFLKINLQVRFKEISKKRVVI